MRKAAEPKTKDTASFVPQYRQGQAMKIFLANDTSGVGHAGSDAAMRSIKHQLRFHSLVTHPVGSLGSLEGMRECDIVVVNGEGTIHHETDGALVLMQIMLLAQMNAKPVYLVNALYQNFNRFSIFDRIEKMQVRDLRSFEFARAHGINRVSCHLDSVFDPEFAYPRQRNRKGTLAGSIDSASPYAHVMEQLPGWNRYHCWNLGFDALVKVLSGAELYITGQWHGVCAAILAQTPFIYVPSNSHKIEGFLEWMDFAAPSLRDIKHLDAAINQAEAMDWPLLWSRVESARQDKASAVFCAEDL